MIFQPFVFMVIILILTTVALGVMLYAKRSSNISSKCNSDSKLILDDSTGVYLAFRWIARDLLNTILIELFWVLAGVGISGYLTVNFLKPILGGWALLIPAIFFGLLTLLLTAYLKPKWYIILLICAFGFLFFPGLQNIFSEGFYAWEMTYTGGSLDFGRVMQFIFWFGTFVFQTASLVARKIIQLISSKNG